MSGIAGIYHLDGRRVDPELLTRMTDVIAHRGPDGVRHWIDGAVGLGHRRFHTTPESVHEDQPLLDETGNLCLILDGRVDNREELITTLETKGAKLRTDTDAEIILRAYQCWGEECPQKIVGDFAFVVWDKRNQQLFCARDPLGIKPFYYHRDGDRFLCGSELHQLLVDSNVRREPNEGMIGEYLAEAITDNEETLFRGIFRLPPAHCLLVRPGSFRKHRFWDIEPTKEIRYRTDAEYSEHFSAIFKEAVRCRLRSHGRVGAELSGGLDSSSVVGMIQAVRREQELADGFETFSMAFPGLACDEIPYIEDVVRMWGIKSNVVYPDNSEVSAYAEEVRRYQDFPPFPNGVLGYSLMEQARSRGFRVLLTGAGGDEWLTGSYYHYADFLRQRKLLTLLRQIRYDRQFGYDAGVPSIIFPHLALLRVGFLPLVPKPARRALKWVLRRDSAPPWINAQFARRANLMARIRKKSNEKVRRQFATFAQRDIYDNLTFGWLAQGNESGNHAECWFGVEKRAPFFDRRLIEFALALPEEQRWRCDQPKFVLRQAMKGLVPEKIRQRFTKADFSHAFADAFLSLGGERLFDSLTIANLGWINESQVRAMYRKMMHGYSQGDVGYVSYVWRLWMIVGINLWYDTVFLRKSLVPERFPIQAADACLV
jgi:asparagine synthase (glutamine-hydrolysing)